MIVLGVSTQGETPLAQRDRQHGRTALAGARQQPNSNAECMRQQGARTQTRRRSDPAMHSAQAEQGETQLSLPLG
eukprot:COSAG02_NODE_4007_length_5920_cov_5.932829_3_plen_75_part_00